MGINLTNITGATIAGLTSPVYNVTVDVAPSAFGKQYAVTSLGGTQTGVLAHSIANPFTITFSRPATLKQITLNANGTVKAVPMNSNKAITRKAVNCNATLVKVGSIEISSSIPAGAETFDKANVDALFSAGLGAYIQQWQNWRDTVTSGII